MYIKSISVRGAYKTHPQQMDRRFFLTRPVVFSDNFFFCPPTARRARVFYEPRTATPCDICEDSEDCSKVCATGVGSRSEGDGGSSGGAPTASPFQGGVRLLVSSVAAVLLVNIIITEFWAFAYHPDFIRSVNNTTLLSDYHHYYYTDMNIQ